jgi:hypothetical protein
VDRGGSANGPLRHITIPAVIVEDVATLGLLLCWFGMRSDKQVSNAAVFDFQRAITETVYAFEEQLLG